MNESKTENLKSVSLIDTHCHLDFDQFDNDRESVISRAKSAGVTKMITIGCNTDAAPKAIKIAENYEGIFAAVGIHPCDVSEKFTEKPKKESFNRHSCCGEAEEKQESSHRHSCGGKVEEKQESLNFDQQFEIIKNYATNKNVVAIGETGLDFYREENPSKMAQFEAFQKHTELAKELKKPVIVHLRNAEKQALQFLSYHNNFPFVIHCFSGDWNFAKKLLDFGGMLSFTGIVTFKNAAPELLDVVKKVPTNRIMVETDAPFLTPVPNRGKRNEPAFTADTAKCIASLRGMDFKDFAQETTKNAEDFFGV